MYASCSTAMFKDVYHVQILLWLTLIAFFVQKPILTFEELHLYEILKLSYVWRILVKTRSKVYEIFMFIYKNINYVYFTKCFHKMY